MPEHVHILTRWETGLGMNVDIDMNMDTSISTWTFTDENGLLSGYMDIDNDTAVAVDTWVCRYGYTDT